MKIIQPKLPAILSASTNFTFAIIPRFIPGTLAKAKTARDSYMQMVCDQLK